MFDIQKAIKDFKNNKNNAVAFTYENASFSEGPLNGKTISIKDVFATNDAPTQASSKILEGFEPMYDAEVVSKLKKSGGAIIGKTHLDELALGGTGTHSAFGLIKNPLDESRVVGGSSSGAAATLNENIAIAIGSDTGDSVRLPASFVGKVGFKPSYGAVSRFGLFSYASSMDTVGWLTHDVATSILTSKVLFGKDSKDMTSKEVEISNVKETKPKKVGFLKIDGAAEEYIETEYKKLIEKFKNQNIEVEMISIDKKLLELITTVYRIISYSEATSNDSNLTGVSFGNKVSGSDWSEIMTNTRSVGFGEMVQRRFTLGAFYLDSENQEEFFVRAQKIRRLIKNAFNQIMDSVDLLLYPASEGIANKITEKRKDTWITGILTSSNLTGNPSITLPWSSYESMPFGIQLSTKLYSDQELLGYSLWVEKLIGGSHE